jgi:hypothetical protein
MTHATFAIVAKLLQTLGSFMVETRGTLRGIFATYHPEQHYMCPRDVAAKSHGARA